MVSWLLNQSWVFWLVFLLVVLFVLWIIFGGKSHDFVGLKPLSTDVDSVGLVDTQTINNLKYANDLDHPHSTKFSNDEFAGQTSCSARGEDHSTKSSSEGIIGSLTGSNNQSVFDIEPTDSQFRSDDPLPEPQMTPAIQPLTNTQFQTPSNSHNRPLPSPFRPPSSANFRSIGSTKRTPNRQHSYRSPRPVNNTYGQPYDYTQKAKSHYRSVLNNHQGSLPTQTTFGNQKGNIITLKYKPMAAVPTEESNPVEPACAATTTGTHNDVAPPKRTKAESRGEAICRRVLEEIYQREFPSSRPDFLKNPETGYNLELDGYNEDLGIAFEYNGIQHYIYPNWVHRTKDDFMKQTRRDQYKISQCDRSGVYIISIPYEVPHNKIRDFIIYYLPENYQKRIDAAEAAGTEVEDNPPGLPGRTTY